MTGAFTHGDRCWSLRRHPTRPDGPLQAWDAADLYLLQAAESRPPAARLLVINDAFGALAVALAEQRPVSWSDSFLAQQALRHNLAANAFAPEAVSFVPSVREPGGPFDVVLARIPKSLAHWQDQLLRLRSCLLPGARVIAGGMIKHTPARAYRLLEAIIGPTRTSLGWRKARLADAVFEPDRSLPPRLDDAAYAVEGQDLVLHAGPNVFARDRLDLGARALLPWLPTGDSAMRVADLGCGNGVLSLVLARRNPAASVLGVDESYQAVASARRNATQAGLLERDVAFEVGDGLEAVPAQALDLVVNNPPFHQDHTLSDETAWAMFRGAARALVPSGGLLVVGNRHLAHQRRLARLFAEVSVLRDDGRFAVWFAVRPRGGVGP